MKDSSNCNHESGFERFLFSDFVLIAVLGTLFYFLALEIRGFYTNKPFVIGIEILIEIIPIYATVNVAILSLAPVFVSHVRGNVKQAVSKKKRKKLNSAINGLLDSFCRGTIIWSVILLVLCVLSLALKDSVLFAIVSSFELSLVLVYTLTSSIMLKSSWPNEFAENKLTKG